MATQVRLSYAWASTGGKTDPGNTEYNLGWIAEIPTFQEFNYVLNAMDTNIKVLAEQSEFEWDPLVTYKAGAEVWYNNTKFIAKTANTNVDPWADATQSYWVQTPVYGKAANQAVAKEGLYLHGVASKPDNTWAASDMTIYNNSSIISMMVAGSGSNYLFANVKGDMVFVDVDQVPSPDNRPISVGQAGVYKIFHEGNPPTIADVGQGLGENPIDGNQYLRYNNTWKILNRANASDVAAGIANPDIDRYLYNYITPEALENSGKYATVDYVDSQSSSFAPGTKMFFAQSSAPTGWTKFTGYDNRIMRIKSSSGGGTGGTGDPIHWNHRHFGGTEWVYQVVDDASGASGYGAAVGTWGHKHEIKWDSFDPRYVDVICCTKS